MLDIIALYTGYAALVFLAILLCLIIVNIDWDNNWFTFTIFKFGIIICRTDEAMDEIVELSSRGRRRIYITAPKWFNKNIYNIGGLQ